MAQVQRRRTTSGRQTLLSVLVLALLAAPAVGYVVKKGILVWSCARPDRFETEKGDRQEDENR